MTPFVDHVTLTLDGMVPQKDRHARHMHWHPRMAEQWGAQLPAVATAGRRKRGAGEERRSDGRMTA